MAFPGCGKANDAVGRYLPEVDSGRGATLATMVWLLQRNTACSHADDDDDDDDDDDSRSFAGIIFTRYNEKQLHVSYIRYEVVVVVCS